MCKRIENQGVWNHEDQDMAASCIRYAPHFVVRAGVLMRVKFKLGTSGAHRTGKLPPSLQVYIPDEGGLRRDLIEAVHIETGHGGVMRTYQALNDRCMWIGMFAQTQKLVGECVKCRMHAPKAPAAPIQGHVSAQAPGEVVTMDLVHMPMANGMD